MCPCIQLVLNSLMILFIKQNIGKKTSLKISIEILFPQEGLDVCVVARLRKITSPSVKFFNSSP